MTRQTSSTRPPARRRIHQLALLALSAGLCWAAFAPVGQFYLAWVALVPFLTALGNTRTPFGAAACGAVGGFLFYIITLGWLWRATIPGTIGVSCYLAIFWGLAALIIWSAGLLDRSRVDRWHRIPVAAGLIAVVWASNEWLRGYVLGGFPWAFLSQTQTPVLSMCQIADITGSYGVTFWIVLVNATLYFAWTSRRRAIPAVVLATVVVIAIASYGVFRIRQTEPQPGPVVMVVQPNHPHERGGQKTVTQGQQIEFHLRITREALRIEPVDLVVWSETVMPPLNPEARDEPGLADGPFLRQTNQTLSSLAAEHRTALLTGAYYVGGWTGEIGKRQATDIRNSAFFYDQAGQQSASRYDKIHLVPFAEFLPFRESAPAIYRVLRWFAAYSVDYPIVAADPDALTLFELKANGGSYRFVTPICFEDTDAALVARMFRPESGDAKRADFIVNITNDGWFRGIQQAQHLQGAILRSIENRVPTARADNTGISGFVDSCGQALKLIPARTEGTSTMRLSLDGRTTFYTRFGDVFGVACTVVSLGVFVGGLWRRWREQSRGGGDQ